MIDTATPDRQHGLAEVQARGGTYAELYESESSGALVEAA